VTVYISLMNKRLPAVYSVFDIERRLSNILQFFW